MEPSHGFLVLGKMDAMVRSMASKIFLAVNRVFLSWFIVETVRIHGKHINSNGIWEKEYVSSPYNSEPSLAYINLGFFGLTQNQKLTDFIMI